MTALAEPDERALVAAGEARLTAAQVLAGLQTVRAVLAPDLTDDELRLFAMVAARSGLDPFAKQVYAVKRQGRVTFQTGIDGYRSIAARTGEYDGQDEPEFGPACGCGSDRPAGHPEYAIVRVYRKGVGRPIPGRADWHEFKPDPGQSGRQDALWVRMPRVMLAKVAEALALRKAFPYDPEHRVGIGADLYTVDEMAQAGPQPAPPSAVLTPRERLAARRAELLPASGAVPGEPGSLAPDGGAVPGMSRGEFLALVADAGLPAPVVAAAAEHRFPGVPSREYGPGEWAALAAHLGLADRRPATRDEVEP